MAEDMTDAPGEWTWASLIDTIVEVSDKYRDGLQALVTLREFDSAGPAAADQAVEMIPFFSSLSSILKDWLLTAAAEPSAVEYRADSGERTAVELMLVALLGAVPDYPVVWEST